MKYVTLGGSGLKVSVICMGMMGFGDTSDREWALDTGSARLLVERALDAGVNFFDTANSYSGGQSEITTGRILGQLTHREEVVVATKVFMPMSSEPNGKGLSRKHIFHAIDDSLRRLNMDYVDVYQIHRFDTRTPIEETMSALDDVVRAGKALYLGASSMHAWQFQKAQYAADMSGGTRFISMQNRYNLIYREEEREMAPLCRDQGVGMIPWSPLARGKLARAPEAQPTKRSETDRFGKIVYATMAEADAHVIAAVDAVARARKLPHAQIALAWLLRQSGVTSPIVGATKMQHLDDAVGALAVTLTDDEVKSLEKPYVPHPIAGHS